MTLYVEYIGSEPSHDIRYDGAIAKMANLLGPYTKLDKQITDNPNATEFFVIDSFKYYVPIIGLDSEKIKKELTKELEYNKGFLKSVQVKLANERFVQNAKPELIELERKKQADAEAKIKALEEQLKAL
jgi:valyl-tRNA synthetase